MINFLPKKQIIIHYIRYIFEMSQFTLFIGLNLLYLQSEVCPIAKER